MEADNTLDGNKLFYLCPAPSDPPLLFLVLQFSEPFFFISRLSNLSTPPALQSQFKTSSPFYLPY